jgi:hypothetical protein
MPLILHPATKHRNVASQICLCSVTTLAETSIENGEELLTLTARYLHVIRRLIHWSRHIFWSLTWNTQKIHSSFYPFYLCLTLGAWSRPSEWICRVSNAGLTAVRRQSVIVLLQLKGREPGSSVSTVSDCGLDGRDSIPDRGRGFFLYPLLPDRLWGPPSLLYNWYRGLFPRVQSAAGAWCWPLTPF